MSSPPSDQDARQIWERVMETSPLPRGYKKTSVLFLGWAEEEDDTEGYDEVKLHLHSIKRLRKCQLTGN
jgi:hypothetical protein